MNAENDQLLKTRTTADRLGRPILTEQTEGGTNYTIYSRKAYDQIGKITYASSPMRYNTTASTDSVDVNLGDGNPHQVAVYSLDWDGNNGRQQRLEILDASTNAVLDTRDVSSFSNGKYSVWSLHGHVKIRVTNLGSPNAVISGLFFDTPSSGSGADIQWLVADQLGTPRMIFDKTGSLAGMKRHDYLPFGEELTANQGLRTATQGYNVNDGIRQKFTSKERDNETGLDYFGARYYASTQGRFTSPDSLYFQAMMAIDPQRFNLYAYTRNNPLKFIDPSGEKVSLGGKQDWLRTNVLYEMAGGQENFDRS